MGSIALILSDSKFTVFQAIIKLPMIEILNLKLINSNFKLSDF